MRAAVSRGAGVFEIEEQPLPEPGPDEVRIRIEACGICGTDLHFHRGGLMAPGHTPGHEMAGRVDAARGSRSGIAEGDRVVVEPLRSCGRCDHCRRGNGNICRQFKLHGVHLPGGFAEYVAVPRERIYPLRANVAAPVAALAEPLAVAVHGLARGGLEKDQRVLVLGAGSVGLVTLVAARALGAGEIWMTSRHPHQQEQARRLGAHRVLSESEASPAELGTLAASTNFDLVVETVGGSADTLMAACAAIRAGGSIVVLGLFMGPVTVEPYSLLVKEGNLHWSNCYSQPRDRDADFAVAADLVAREAEALAPLVTHEIPLERIGDAFDLASNKSAGAVKVSVLP